MMLRPSPSLALLALFAAQAACTDAPDEPTWGDDVAPVLAANCIRCHASPPIDGAPDTFRLDVWQDTIADDGRRILGAGNMAEFIAARVNKGDMPPRLELTGRQKDILNRWVDQRSTVNDPPPPGPPRGQNRAPQAYALSRLDVDEDGTATIDITVTDADRDLVTGTLELATDSATYVVRRDLTNGRRSYTLDLRQIPRGTAYELIARISDHPTQEHARSLASGTLSTPFDDGAPAIAFLYPQPYGTVVNGTAEVQLIVTDAAESEVTLDVEAFRGTEHLVLAETLAVELGSPIAIPWDTTTASEGSGWRLRATASSDAGGDFDAEVGKITIAQTQTSLGFEDVGGILAARCAGCHPGGETTAAAGTSFNATRYEGSSGVEAFCGGVYQRAIVEGSMPPTSARYLLRRFDMPDETELAQLREWLEAGCPQ